MKLKGKFKVEHFRGGKKIGEYDFPNGIVDVGMNSLLDSEFRNQAQPATWYIGLVDNAGWTAFANSDTMASHPGWAEFTGYSQATRVAWVTVAAASRSITNTSASVFSINAGGTLKGVFITSNSTISGTTGTLWATAAFASTQPVLNGDTLNVTYTVSG